MYVIDQQNATFLIDGNPITAYRAIVNDEKSKILLHCKAMDQAAAEAANVGHQFTIEIDDYIVLSEEIKDAKITYITSGFKDNLKPALLIDLELETTELLIHSDLVSNHLADTSTALILYPVKMAYIVPKEKSGVKELVDLYETGNADPS